MPCTPLSNFMPGPPTALIMHQLYTITIYYSVTVTSTLHTDAHIYTTNLQAIAQCVNPHPPPLPPALRSIITPLCLPTWRSCLRTHPDPAFMSYILDGIKNGFRVGFSYSTSPLTSASTNHPSANEHPNVITSALKKEVEKGRLFGPLDPMLYPDAHISSLGAVPKKHSTDKWRLILDLFHPQGFSVNDGIDKALCSLTYIKVDDVVQHIPSLGSGCTLAKIDIESAFRNIPVHPHDRHLLGMLWQDQLYIDMVLPFGLRSAPKIFNCIADALQWIAQHFGVSFIEHFLDDFITLGRPDSDECNDNLLILMLICTILASS